MSHNSRFRFLLCDLDDTLYPRSSGLMQAVGRLIRRYMIERLDLTPAEAERLKRRYYEQYGTTMRGLILHHKVEPEDYLAYVHNLPLERFIRPNPALDEMLARIPLRKAVFTNASREHADDVLQILGVSHHFERIIDIRDFGFNSKPHRMAYRRMLALLDTRPDECILVDDAVHNLVPAKRMGMGTVLVGGDSSPVGSPEDEPDLRIADILHLAEAILPWLRD